MKKKLFSIFALLCMAVSGAWADYEVQIGEGTSTTTGYHPFYTLYNYSISESLYLASELTAAGVEAGPITSLSWYATNETGYAQQGISIWLANVSDTELTTSSHLATGMTQVYTNGTVTPVIGWNEFQCNGDFSWDGTSNLLILVQRNNGEWNSTVSWQATADLGFNCMSYKYQDSDAYDVTASNTMYTSTTRPNIIIKGESAGGFSLTEGENEHGTIAFTNAAGKTITSAQEGQTVTVTVTPATGYVVNEVSGKWYAAIAATPRRTGIDLLNAVELTPVQGQENQWTFTMARANAEISATYKKLLTHADITIDDIDDMTYNGQAQTPEVVVKDGTTMLVENTDYTVSYSNNINAGEATAAENAPTVTITAVSTSDKYAGTATKTFTIKKAAGELSFNPDRLTKTYGDPNFTHTPTFTGNGKLYYWSMDKSVATVNDETGEVTIVGVGRVNIWARISESDNYNQTQIFYILNVEPKEIEYEGGDVTQDENGYTVILTEDADNPNPAPLPDDADLAKLTYSRTLTAPGTGEGDKTIDGQAANLFTVCLPFAPKTDDAAKYYTLSGVSGETLLFDEVTTPAANIPYLVAVTGSVNFLEDCADLNVASMEIATTTKDGYTFSGTFTGLTNAQAAGKYILQKGNTWGKVTSEKPNAFIPPFRAYVEAPATAAPLLIGTIGNTTGIENIRTVDRDGTERWYDLNGRRIATPAKGINILNGKKVVVK